MVDKRTDVTKIDIPEQTRWERLWATILRQPKGPKSITTEIKARGYGVTIRLKRTYHSLENGE